MSSVGSEFVDAIRAPDQGIAEECLLRLVRCGVTEERVVSRGYRLNVRVVVVERPVAGHVGGQVYARAKLIFVCGAGKGADGSAGTARRIEGFACGYGIPEACCEGGGEVARNAGSRDRAG